MKQASEDYINSCGDPCGSHGCLMESQNPRSHGWLHMFASHSYNVKVTYHLKKKKSYFRTSIKLLSNKLWKYKYILIPLLKSQQRLTFDAKHEYYLGCLM